MIKSIKLLVAFMVLSIGLPVQAAMITPGYRTTPVVIGNDSNDFVGNIGANNDWLLDVQPAAVNSPATFETIGFPTIDFTLFTCSGAACAANDWTAVLPEVTSSLSTILMGTSQYFVRVFGPATRGYVVGVSAVPIPAAALLFLSGLAGFGLLSRKRNRAA